MILYYHSDILCNIWRIRSLIRYESDEDLDLHHELKIHLCRAFNVFNVKEKWIQNIPKNGLFRILTVKYETFIYYFNRSS